MNHMYLLYQDGDIQIYYKSNIVFDEYLLISGNKILARYNDVRLHLMRIEVKYISFGNLLKFHEVVVDHILKPREFDNVKK